MEYTHGKGIVLTFGWRVSNWHRSKDPKEEYRGNLELIHVNMLKYLSEKSAFKAVSPSGKLAQSWGKIKSEY